VAVGVLKNVGRWVLRRISTVGRRRILAYMTERISLFHERLATAATRRRKRWLEFRIRNWVAARDWIKRHWARLTRRGASRIAREIKSRLQDRVPQEAFETWVTA